VLTEAQVAALERARQHNQAQASSRASAGYAGTGHLLCRHAKGRRVYQQTFIDTLSKVVVRQAV